VEMSADEALAEENDVSDDGSQSSIRQAAGTWLLQLLGEGEMQVATIKAQAQAAGINFRSVQRAAEDMGIIRERSAMDGRWQWRMNRG
jgi:hypothetical protein